MKIQLAIDRVSLEKAIEIVHQAKDSIDIIEIGTSLFLDYGLDSLRTLRKEFEHIILADFKTIDEADYEFGKIYSAGANIATVMGASSIETIRICQKQAQKHNKDYMIDILELNDEKIEELVEFEDAIICLHLPNDKDGNIKKYINKFIEKHQFNNRLAAAGGIILEDLPYLKEAGIEIAIVGSSITKSGDIKNIARLFKENS